MIRTSVKKPYTVLVGVILCIVLGIVSFTGLTTDLLPSIDLPMMIVSTVYPGANPEKVELTVTDPVEKAVATISGLENITSVSQENVSMVMLEFNYDTNMDTALLEVNNALQKVTGSFDDLVQTPTVMKLNPDMLPVEVISVDKDGMDIKELTTFLENDILPELERIYGVATISSEGMVKDHLEIQLDQDKIDKINEDILKSIDSGLLDTKRELDDAERELTDGIKKLEDGQKEAFDGLASGSAQLDSANAQLQSLSANKIKFETNKGLLDGQKKALQGKIDLETAKSSINILKTELEKLLNTNPSLGPITLNNILLAISDPKIKDDVTLLFNKLYNVNPAITNQTTLSDAITTIDTMIGAMDTSIAEIETTLTSMGFVLTGNNTNDMAKIDADILENDSELAKATLTANSLKSKITEIEDGLKALEVKKMETTSDLTKANVELENAQKELEKGVKEFEKARDSALQQANIDSLVTLDALAGILQAQNFSMPAGSIVNEKGVKTSIKIGDKFSDVESLENLLLLDMGLDEVDPIYLKDVGTISIKDNANESYTIVNDNPAILLSFNKSSVVSTTEVTDSIGEKTKELELNNSGLHFTELTNQGIYINMVINGVMQNLVFGGVIAFVLLLLFLKDLRPTLVIGFAIPISLLFAVVLMYFSGITLNIISLAGLSLGVGMLVDNSIVVIENIYRLRNSGMSKYKAALEGASQVSMAIFASTLTTVCVFLPIVFVEGITRDIFVDMGLTIAYSLFASLLVALTVVPAMSSYLLSKTTDKENKLFNKLVRIYEKVLKINLKHSWFVILMSISLLVLSIYFTSKMPLVLVPEMSSNQLSMTFKMDVDTNKDVVFENAEKIAKNTMSIEGVDTVGLTANSVEVVNNKPISFTYYVILKDGYSKENKVISEKIKEVNSNYKEYITISTSNMNMSMLTGSGLSYKIKGNDMDTLLDLSSKLKNELILIEGVNEVKDGSETNVNEIRVDIDKNKAAEYNLMVAQVYKTIAEKTTDEKKATTMTFQNQDYETIIVPALSYTSESIKDVVVTTDTVEYEVDGESKTKDVDIYLKDIAKIYNAAIPSAINHDNQSRVITVNASIEKEYNAALVSRNAKEIIDNFKLPNGYILEEDGEDVMVNKTINDMIMMILLAIIFIYLIMVAQFQSLLSPFIILFTIPLAFTGGLLGLKLTNQDLTMTGMIGFLVLAGVVVNNGIVFVDYVNQLRMGGLNKHDALTKAGRDRMKPILMTALTTILAMSTMALGIGEGAEMSQAMAIVTIGGLSYATLLTLFLVPVLYNLLYRKEIKNIESELV